MALSGNIKEFGLADIFQIVSLQQKTGVLTIEGTEGKATILLENGLIVGSDATFRPLEERLQQSLVQSQQLSKFQLKRATETQKKTHQPLWTILGEMGELNRDTLQKMLSQQIHETVYHVLRWTEGLYRFDPQKNVEYDHQLIAPVNTEFLIMEGFRITDEWSELEKEIPSLHIAIRRVAETAAPPADLSAAEAKVYQLLTAPRAIQEVIDMAQLGEFDTCQTIYELMRKHLVEKVPGKKGKGAQLRRIALDVKEVALKAAAFAAGIAVLGGVMFLFTYLPKNFAVIQVPRFQTLGQVKQYTAQAQLHELAQGVTRYFLAQRKLPATFDELLQAQFLASKKALTDPWGREYLLNAEKNNVVIIRSAGKDGVPNTEDDLTLAIPLG